MDKRVYGVIGIVSIMSNWNADFTGYPKTISTGEIFGSDKALKYPMKKMWQDRGEKILYIKSMKTSDNKGEISLVPRSLKERYEYLFECNDLVNEKDIAVVLKNLFSALDVKSFGATFAEAKKNISITGAVQIGQGFNKYDGSEAEEQQILSPFRDPTAKPNSEEKGEAKNSTLGTKIVSNEAHYFYPFTINSAAYDEFVEMGVTDGYTEDDYRKFKDVSLNSATAYATNAKIGCDNEFAVFVETEKDVYLPNLAEMIEFEKIDDKNKITLKFDYIINKMKDRIKNVEVYYNPDTTNIISKIEGAKFFNIYTKEEV